MVKFIKNVRIAHKERFITVSISRLAQTAMTNVKSTELVIIVQGLKKIIVLGKIFIILN